MTDPEWHDPYPPGFSDALGDLAERFGMLATSIASIYDERHTGEITVEFIVPAPKAAQ